MSASVSHVSHIYPVNEYIQALKKQYDNGVYMEEKAIVNLGKDGIELQFNPEPLQGWTLTRSTLYKKVQSNLCWVHLRTLNILLVLLHVHTYICMHTKAQHMHNITCIMYQEVWSYLLSRDWAGLKRCPVLKVWEKLQDKHSKAMQNSYRWKPLSM